MSDQDYRPRARSDYGDVVEKAKWRDREYLEAADWSNTTIKATPLSEMKRAMDMAAKWGRPIFSDQPTTLYPLKGYDYWIIFTPPALLRYPRWHPLVVWHLVKAWWGWPRRRKPRK